MGDGVTFITRPGGRRVAVHMLAGGGGKLVVFCHAAPGSGAFDPNPEAALAPLAAGPADQEALALPGARERLGKMLGEAYAQGAVGMAADILSYCLRPWGFEPGEAQVKTLLLYGAKDPVAGSRHGSWWQKQLPNARLEMVPDGGHLLVLRVWERALSHLAPGTKHR